MAEILGLPTTVFVLIISHKYDEIFAYRTRAEAEHTALHWAEESWAEYPELLPPISKVPRAERTACYFSQTPETYDINEVPMP